MDSSNLATTASQQIFHNGTGSHSVQICLDEASQVKTLTRYIMDGLSNNEAVIAIAKTALRKAVMSNLYALGYDMQALKNRDQVKFFDAEFLLSDLLLDGVLEEQAFQVFVVLPVQAAKLKYQKVRAFGEMVDILWQNGQYNSAIQLEELWSNLCKKEDLNLLCTYFLTSLDESSYDYSLEQICRYHSPLIPMNNITNPNSDSELPDKFRAAWNQVVAKLEGSHQIISNASF